MEEKEYKKEDLQKLENALSAAAESMNALVKVLSEIRKKE